MEETLFQLGVRIQDLVILTASLISVALAYGRLKSEIRHLEDTKVDHREMQLLTDELRGSLGDIRTSLARLEESLKFLFGSQEKRDRNPPC